ncbi:dynein axonemal assembly factor 6 [Diachasmimorpha longicaudata]|uniref:dynein axonemal assembly factor 6 n=1 Tax=Diachasmimorpha longicaudata TaxID=58733 RepID=UPI0030B88485
MVTATPVVSIHPSSPLKTNLYSVQIEYSIKVIFVTMDGFSVSDIKALQSLLAPEASDSDSDDDLDQKGKYKLGPGHIGPPKGRKTAETPPHEPLKPLGNDIWHPSEVPPAQATEVSDPRVQPEYEIKFKQAITTEDVFLGMGFKTPGSASCEWLAISIKMPGEMKEKIDLSVESDSVNIRSSKYRLHLPTPHLVDPNTSSAKWHEGSSTLELNLKMTRELDAVNF